MIHSPSQIGKGGCELKTQSELLGVWSGDMNNWNCSDDCGADLVRRKNQVLSCWLSIESNREWEYLP
jgi:hypothetical protein